MCVLPSVTDVEPTAQGFDLTHAVSQCAVHFSSANQSA